MSVADKLDRILDKVSDIQVAVAHHDELLVHLVDRLKEAEATLEREKALSAAWQGALKLLMVMATVIGLATGVAALSKSPAVPPVEERAAASRTQPRPTPGL